MVSLSRVKISVICLIIVMGLILFQFSMIPEDMNEFLFQSLPTNTDTTHGFIGVSGPELLRIFKKNLLKSSTSHRRIGRCSLDGNTQEEYLVPGQPRAKYKISALYDEIYQYLFEQDDATIVQKINQDVPITGKVHSHNDYWRSVPLLEALMHGVTSVEADVWLSKGDTQLAVSHSEMYIDNEHRTLDLLYTSPLLQMLEQLNTKTNMLVEGMGTRSGETAASLIHGPFYGDASQTLQLLIDFKSEDSVKTYQLLMSKYLRVLVEKKYLTFMDLDTGAINYGPITIVLTGNYPSFSELLDSASDGELLVNALKVQDSKRGYFEDGKRYVFLDLLLSDPESFEKSPESVLASASFSQMLTRCNSSSMLARLRGRLSDMEIDCMKDIIGRAQAHNLKTRIWDVPQWPLHTRTTLWKQQYHDLNVDYLNVDDLDAVFNF